MKVASKVYVSLFWDIWQEIFTVLIFLSEGAFNNGKKNHKSSLEIFSVKWDLYDFTASLKIKTAYMVFSKQKSAIQ
jgi:hypothetical protein